MGVGPGAAARILTLIVDEAKSAGLIQELKGTNYVNLKAAAKTAVSARQPAATRDADADEETYDEDAAERDQQLPPEWPQGRSIVGVPSKPLQQDNRRVFVTPGRNRAFIETIKELLAYGEMEPVVAMEHETVSQPVPDKSLTICARVAPP